MTPLLRPATAADAPRIADLLIDTRKTFMPYAPSAHTEDDVRAWVASRLLPNGGVVVAEVDGSVVGVMATTTGEEASWITQMAVQPGMVGRGLGTHLLARATGTLNSPIRLWTFQQNTGARRFYERNGFVAIAFTDGRDNEEHCPDVLYEFRRPRADA
jgi:GNAT superfamily N-acetyltransferase